MNTHTILEYFADGDKKIIIDSISDSPKTIKSILKHCKLPKTSGYRKVNQLINDGLLFVNGYEDGKKIKKYETVIKDVKIHTAKNAIVIKIPLKKGKIR